MESALPVILLGAIALASLAQSFFLVVVLNDARRMARRLDQIQERFARDLSPAFEHLSHASRNPSLSPPHLVKSG